jgi:hypothetical protein
VKAEEARNVLYSFVSAAAISAAADDDDDNCDDSVITVKKSVMYKTSVTAP